MWYKSGHVTPRNPGLCGAAAADAAAHAAPATPEPKFGGTLIRNLRKVECFVGGLKSVRSVQQPSVTWCRTPPVSKSQPLNPTP